MMSRRLRIAAGCAGVVAGIAGCASGGKAPAASTSSTAAVVRTTLVPSTTATTVVAEVAPQPSPEQAANALLDSWRRGDRATALRVASVGAVDTTFAHAAGATNARGCQEPVGQTSDCAFGYAGGLLVLHTVQTPSGLWVVDSANFEG